MKIDFKELKSILEKLYPNQIEREEASLCIRLLQANGGEFELFEEESKIMSFTFDGYQIDFTEDEIVFIGDEGDFAHLEIDYYTLLGYMIHTSFLSVGFKRAYCESAFRLHDPRDNVEGYRNLCSSCLKKIEDKTNETTKD